MKVQLSAFLTIVVFSLSFSVFSQASYPDITNRELRCHMLDQVQKRLNELQNIEDFMEVKRQILKRTKDNLEHLSTDWDLISEHIKAVCLPYASCAVNIDKHLTAAYRELKTNGKVISSTWLKEEEELARRIEHISSREAILPYFIDIKEHLEKFEQDCIGTEDRSTLSKGDLKTEFKYTVRVADLI